MVLVCKALEPQTPEYSWWIIAQFPQAWEGKAEACCTIKVNYPGAETTSGSSTIATLLLLVPTLLHPQDSRKAEGEVQTSEELSSRAVHNPGGAGREGFPSHSNGLGGCSQTLLELWGYFKANWFPLSPLTPGSGVGWTRPPSCSLLKRVLWGCAGFGVPCGGRVVGQRGLLFPQGSRCFWKCWLGISSALRAGALAWAVLCGSWGGSCLPPSFCL